MLLRKAIRSAARSSLRPIINGNVGGLARTPGSKTGVELSTVTTSRKFKPASTGAITVAAGLEYSLDGGSTWTSNAGTWGAARYCLVRLTSSGSYSDPVTKAITINGVAMDFVVTTRAENLVDLLLKQEDGSAWLNEDGTSAYMEG